MPKDDWEKERARDAAKRGISYFADDTPPEVVRLLDIWRSQLRMQRELNKAKRSRNQRRRSRRTAKRSQSNGE